MSRSHRFGGAAVMSALVALSCLASAEAKPAPAAWHAPLKIGNECAGGIRYDDGSFEAGYGFSTASSHGSAVMRFDLPSSNSNLRAVCLCWRQLGSAPGVDYDLNVWDSNGPGGGPGTLLAKVTTLRAEGVTGAGTFQRIDFGDGFPVHTSSIYIGPDWNPSLDVDFSVCADENGPVQQPGYSSIDGLPPEVQLGTAGAHPSYKALGIRAEVDGPSGACIPSDTALCLNGGRFRVEATFVAPGVGEGTAHGVRLTDETGYLWFFSAGNVEAVVKVLNGCSFNERYWVFAGGLTNVKVNLTVTDTQTGAVKTYTNPQGTNFQPITDTSAFATCP